MNPDTSAINVALAQIDITPNRPDINTQKILSIIEEQREKGTDLLVFPEQAVAGYMLGDKWGSDAFAQDVHSYNEDIAAASGDMTVVWGNVGIDEDKTNTDGAMRKYNSAFVAQNGELLEDNTVNKTSLPTYRQFHDRRHFTSQADKAREEGRELVDTLQVHELEIGGVRRKVGIVLCEDQWWEDYGEEFNVPRILKEKGAEFIINLSCSPWGLGKNNKRNRVVQGMFTNTVSTREAIADLTEEQRDEGVPVLYVNNAGTQDIGKTLFTFDGGTTVYDKRGGILAEAQQHQEDVLEFALDTNQLAEESDIPEVEPIAEVKQALVTGLRDFCERCGMKQVVLGISGGIDSAVTAALWKEVLGAENVYGISMPTKFNSNLTKDAGAKLARNLGIHFAVRPIQERFDGAVESLEEIEFDGPGGATPVELSGLGKENVQARLRGSEVLMGVASALPQTVISCNGNKTETAFGYATLYGDILGGIAPIGDLLKGQVYDLARHINQEADTDVIPQEIIDMIPSAELSDDQDIEAGQGDPFFYAYHDQLVKHWVEYLWQPEQILELYQQGTLEETLNLPAGSINQAFPTAEDFVADLEHKWGLMHRNVFKRYQGPPIIKVSSRAFGYDFHESQVGTYYTRAYNQLRDTLLQA